MSTPVKLVIIILLSLVIFVLVRDIENKAPQGVKDKVEGFHEKP